MTPEHVAALLHYVATVDDRMHRMMATEQQVAALIRTWVDALEDVPATVEGVRWDAACAVRRFYEQRDGDRSASFRSVKPSDILAAWSSRRSELMNRHIDPTPAVDPDDVAAYLNELRTTRAAVASGRAAPSGQGQLADTHRSRGVAWAAGGPIPARIRGELARRRVGAA